MPVAGEVLADRHGRVKRKLRLSFTDRCNFHRRCCMPDHPQWLPKKELLTREEMLLLAGLFIDAGIEASRCCEQMRWNASQL